jgi:hypothetical protein
MEGTEWGDEGRGKIVKNGKGKTKGGRSVEEEEDKKKGGGAGEEGRVDKAMVD